MAKSLVSTALASFARNAVTSSIMRWASAPVGAWTGWAIAAVAGISTAAARNERLNTEWTSPVVPSVSEGRQHLQPAGLTAGFFIA